MCVVKSILIATLVSAIAAVGDRCLQTGTDVPRFIGTSTATSAKILFRTTKVHDRLDRDQALRNPLAVIFSP
jgi:hypothetical protein